VQLKRAQNGEKVRYPTGKEGYVYIGVGTILLIILIILLIAFVF
jgi:hypothetical protein